MKIASLLVGLIARTSAELPQNGGYTLKNSEGCYNDDGSANRCSPDFHNIAYGKPVSYHIILLIKKFIIDRFEFFFKEKFHRFPFNS